MQGCFGLDQYLGPSCTYSARKTVRWTTTVELQPRAMRESTSSIYRVGRHAHVIRCGNNWATGCSTTSSPDNTVETLPNLCPVRDADPVSS